MSMSVDGLGEGERVNTMDEDETIGTPQNIPIHPGKHSHTTTPAPRSTHSPFVQLTNSHIDTITVGEGETKIVLGDDDRKLVGKIELCADD